MSAPDLRPDPAPPLERAVASVARGTPARAGRYRVVAVDGRSGAGKTVFAGALAAALGGAPVLHLEDLYPGWDGLAATVPLVAGALGDLAAGRRPRLRRWDWTADAPGGPLTLPVGRAAVDPVLVVEGVGSAARACAPFLSVVVWMDGPEGWRRQRALARDGATYRPHWRRWADQEAAYVAAERPQDRADVVIGPEGPTWWPTGTPDT